MVGAQLREGSDQYQSDGKVRSDLRSYLFSCVLYICFRDFASGLALVIYTGLVLVSLNAFDITLTLPGIAGIILGIGMAVDANVIIFARVGERAERQVKSVAIR